MEELLDLATTGIAAGGDAVARDDGGRVVFVAGGLPGERVQVRLHEERKRFAKGSVAQVVEPSPSRREPPCRFVAAGCGGCDWQHIDPVVQPELKARLVGDALERLGGVADPQVDLWPTLPSAHYRTTVRCAVVGGQAGFRRARSHEPLAVDTCLVTDPRVDELIRHGRFGSATEVTIRVGTRTGERLVLASPTAKGVEVSDDVVVVGTDELARGRHAWYHEEVAGRRWRVSATSFFQARPDGADALVELVSSAVRDLAPGARTMVDLCCGVGLFAGAVGATAGLSVLGVERHAAALHDARHNLTQQGATDVRWVKTSLEQWRPAPVDVVVADPPRHGLGAQAVRTVTATKAALVVLVSCDPAALGRDAKLFGEAGYRLVGATLVDLFPQTSHVEVVSRFVRIKRVSAGAGSRAVTKPAVLSGR